MSNRLERATSLARKSEMPWDDAQLERSLSRLHSKRKKRQRLKRTLATVALLAVVLSVVPFLRPRESPLPIAKASEPFLELPDGSNVRFPSTTQLQLTHESPAYVEVALQQGSAEFQVQHSEHRVFVVRAGKVSVVDLGTVFTVERSNGRVHVAVKEGKVRVESPALAAELTAGESRWFSETPPEVAPPAPVVALPKPAIQRAVRAPAPAPERIEVMLQAADAFRAQEEIQLAISQLQEIIQLFPHDNRSALAAFSLGKLQLEAGDAHDAAESFLQVRQLFPEGPLTEDAMGRELEARVLAGERMQARQLAESYLNRFPQGTRKAVAERALRSQ